MKKLSDVDKTRISLAISVVAIIVLIMALAKDLGNTNRKLNEVEKTLTTKMAISTTEITTTEETTEETTSATTELVKVKPLLIQDMGRRLSTLKALIKETRDKAETLLDKQKKGEQLTADDELYLRFYSSAVFEKQEIEQYLEKYDKEEEG